MKFISVKDALPDNLQDVYVKTDCKDCPVLPALFYNKKFIITQLTQCSCHYEEGKSRFPHNERPRNNEIKKYRDRIVAWCPKEKYQASE